MVQPFPFLLGAEPFWDLAEIGFSSPEFGRDDVVLQIDVDGVDFFGRLRPLANFIPKTLGCRRRYQLSALAQAKRTQWTRDCWPALVPTSQARHTELDWVYLRAIVATVRSRRALAGKSLRAVTMLWKKASSAIKSLRCCASWTPNISRCSVAAGA